MVVVLNLTVCNLAAERWSVCLSICLEQTWTNELEGKVLFSALYACIIERALRHVNRRSLTRQGN